MQFKVSLDREVDVNFSVDFSTVDHTARADTNDYSAKTGHAIQFAGDQGEEQTVEVGVPDDEIVELDEVFYAELSNVNSSGGPVEIEVGRAAGTILNDDAALVSVNDIQNVEGSDNNQSLSFVISLDQPVDRAFTLDYQTVDGTATTSNNDYQSAQGTLTFVGQEGETQTVIVSTLSDQMVELDETFYLELSNIDADDRQVSLEKSQGLGTLLNDDAPTAVNDVGSIIEDGDALTGSSVVSNDLNHGGLLIESSLVRVSGVAIEGGNVVEVLDFVGAEITGQYGALTIQNDGTYTYELDNGNASVNALNPSSEKLSDLFTYVLSASSQKADEGQLEIQIAGVNDPPSMALGGHLLNYLENGAPERVEPDFTISDPDDTHLSGASVPISGNFVSGEDRLGFTDFGCD